MKTFFKILSVLALLFAIAASALSVYAMATHQINDYITPALYLSLFSYVIGGGFLSALKTVGCAAAATISLTPLYILDLLAAFIVLCGGFALCCMIPAPFVFYSFLTRGD